jgi:hypothetical protein
MTMSTKREGFFRSAINAFVAAREQQASRYVNSALQMLDDDTLRAHSYNPADLRKQGGSRFVR